MAQKGPVGAAPSPCLNVIRMGARSHCHQQRAVWSSSQTSSLRVNDSLAAQHRPCMATQIAPGSIRHHRLPSSSSFHIIILFSCLHDAQHYLLSCRTLELQAPEWLCHASVRTGPLRRVHSVFTVVFAFSRRRRRPGLCLVAASQPPSPPHCSALMLSTFGVNINMVPKVRPA